MKIEYNRHARRRMKERGVSEDEVEMTIGNPEHTEQSVKGRMNAFRFMNERYLRVTFKDESNHIMVVTVTIRKRPFKG